jgi:mannose/fructose/N-acetylgalactosamine-specific phosphotransferase system component IIC
MEFLSEIIIISIVGGFIAIDTTAAWQLFFSRPLVACSLLGFFWGQFETGVTTGILLELPWLLEIPAGGSKIAENNLGAIVSAGVAIHLVKNGINTPNIVIVFAIVWGLSVNWVGSRLVRSMRRMNVMFAYRADNAAKELDLKKISLLHIGGILNAFSLGALIVSVFYILGCVLIEPLVAFIPPFFDDAFSYAKIGLMALGVATVVHLFFTRKKAIYLIAGLLFSLIVFLIFYLVS